jgi:hypothetical protein
MPDEKAPEARRFLSLEHWSGCGMGKFNGDATPSRPDRNSV